MDTDTFLRGAGPSAGSLGRARHPSVRPAKFRARALGAILPAGSLSLKGPCSWGLELAP